MSAAETAPRGRLFVLSGPSGVGKDAVLALMKEMDGLNCRFATTATTRPIRRGERDGVDYVFLTEDRFRALIESDGLLEWAEVYGNLYGVPKLQVTEALARGENALVKIDVQGAATVRRLFPDAVLIFLDPPDAAALERRLRSRATESEAELRRKLSAARAEMREAAWFDRRVTNEEGEPRRAAERVAAIVREMGDGRSEMRDGRGEMREE